MNQNENQTDTKAEEAPKTRAKRPSRKQLEQEEARERLREWVKPGDVIYCILRHRSASGMSRVIHLVKFDHTPAKDGRPERIDPAHLSYNVAKAIQGSFSEKFEGVKISGCGMDMGFALVDDLSHALFGKGGVITHQWL